MTCNLVDINLMGHKFTWSRGRGSNNLIEKRIDQATGVLSWHYMLPNATLKNLVPPISDHSPILLDTSLTFVHRRPRGFKFENKWLDEQNINRVVQRSWDNFKDFGLIQRLNATS